MCDGIIIKGVGGLYTVITKDEKLYKCKARGVFRKNRITPLVGDNVSVSIISENEGIIEEIRKRKNSLVRPAMANITNLFIVAAVKSPPPDIYQIDKLCIIANEQHIKPYIIFNKTDLENFNIYKDLYINTGIEIIDMCTLYNKNLNIEYIKNIIKDDEINVFTGASGVGKSSILNLITDDELMQIGNVSEKIGRGKHTTRHIELFRLNGGFIADTPGFSSVELWQYNITEKEKLQYYFPEFLQYIDKCRFTGCIHINTRDCAVINAVKQGEISESRYNNYIRMYESVKNIKKWEK